MELYHKIIIIIITTGTIFSSLPCGVGLALCMFGYVEEIGLVPTDIPGSGPGGHLHS